MRPPLLTIRMLLLVPASIFLAAPAMSFQNEDRVTYANSPQDLYEAKLGILKSKIEAQKGECRSTGGGQGKSYCLRSLDNELREGERELKRQLEKALAAEPD